MNYRTEDVYCATDADRARQDVLYARRVEWLRRSGQPVRHPGGSLVERFAGGPWVLEEDVPVSDPMIDALDAARSAKLQHSAALMVLPHVVGVGVGRDDEGFHVTVYLSEATDGIPATLDGVPVVTRVIGTIHASASPLPAGHPDAARPVPREGQR